RADSSKYQNKWDTCPMVRHWIDPSHPLFKGLTKGLATNRPSFLRGRFLDLPLLADFPEDCRYDFHGLHSLQTDEGYICASSRDRSRAGRTLILAGQGVFLNGMLVQDDNDNFAFAWNAVQWLAGDRQHALFIDNGRTVEKFDLPLDKFSF